MAAGRKWVYWHRVISVTDGVDLHAGELIGIDNKDTSCMRFVWNEQRKTLEFKDCAKLQYLGKLLRTATPEEIVAAFPKE